MKNTTEKFRKKYIKYQTEPRRGITVWGRGEAEPAKKNCLEAASSRGRCIEDSIPDDDDYYYY